MFAGSLFVTFWAAPLAAEMITIAIAVILTKKTELLYQQILPAHKKGGFRQAVKPVESLSLRPHKERKLS